MLFTQSHIFRPYSRFRLKQHNGYQLEVTLAIDKSYQHKVSMSDSPRNLKTAVSKLRINDLHGSRLLAHAAFTFYRNHLKLILQHCTFLNIAYFG